MKNVVETQVPAGAKLGIRPGVGRKLLERKALEIASAADGPTGDALEDSFPVTAHDQPNPNEPVSAKAAADPGEATNEHTSNSVDIAAANAPPPPLAAQEPALTFAEQRTAAQVPRPATTIAWSAEDEGAFQTLAARRKAAGYQRRGRDVSDQIVRLGGLTPNPNTIVAVIVALVSERGGSVGRSDLIAAMAGATYPHGKARPDDKGWCQGYVAGAVRNGFLALGDDTSVVIAGAA